MATTTNYGWVTPDDTDLVKDGAAAIRTLGSSADTTTKNLNPETTLGDLSFRSSTANVNTRLGIGSAGQNLTVVAGVPAWSTPSDQTPLTTKGDLFTFSTTDDRLAVGTNGQVLTADSNEATGLKFATPAVGAYTLLSTTTLAAASTTISGISGSHKHLFIQGKNIFAVNNDDLISFRFNSDTSSNYNFVNIRSEATTLTAAVQNSATSLSQIIDVNNGNDATQMSQFTLWLYRYTDTDNINGIVNAKGAGVVGGNGTRTQSQVIFNYDCSAAITSLTITCGTSLTGEIYIYGVN